MTDGISLMIRAERTAATVLAVVTFLACASCDTSSSENAPPGTERGKCLPGGVCGLGLTCLSDFCVDTSPDEGDVRSGGPDGGGAENGSGSGPCVTSHDCADEYCNGEACWCIEGTCQPPSVLWQPGRTLPDALNIQGIRIELDVSHSGGVVVEHISTTGDITVQGLALGQDPYLMGEVSFHGTGSVTMMLDAEITTCTIPEGGSVTCDFWEEDVVKHNFMESSNNLECWLSLTPLVLPEGQLAYTTASSTPDSRLQAFQYNVNCKAMDQLPSANSIDFDIESSQGCHDGTGGSYLVSFSATSDPDSTCKHKSGCEGAAWYASDGVDLQEGNLSAEYTIELEGPPAVAKEWPLLDYGVKMTAPAVCP